MRVAFDDDFLYIARPSAATATRPASIVNEIRKDFVPAASRTRSRCCSTRSPIAATASSSPPTRAGARPTRRSPTKAATSTRTGTRCGGSPRRRTAEGWTAEFRSRSRPCAIEGGDGHDWGINFSRRIRRKNEVSYWSPVSRAFTIYRASSDGDLHRASRPPAGTQHAHQAIPARRRRARRRCAAVRRRLARPASTSRPGVTPSMTLDVTINPDFAQAEADEQQVNLTQFSLFYPGEARVLPRERRHLLLRRHPAQPAAGRRASVRPKKTCCCSSAAASASPTPASSDPLYGGARLTGRAGGYGLGFMTMQSEDVTGRPSNNYTVARVRRDVLANSDVGAIVLSRDADRQQRRLQPRGRRRCELPLLPHLSLNGFAARSERPGETRNQGTSQGCRSGWEDSEKRLQASIMHDRRRLPRRPRLRPPHRRHPARSTTSAWLPQPEALRRHGIRQIAAARARLELLRSVTARSASRVRATRHAGHLEHRPDVEYAFEPRDRGDHDAVHDSPWRRHPAWPLRLEAASASSSRRDHSRALSASLRYHHRRLLERAAEQRCSRACSIVRTAS